MQRYAEVRDPVPKARAGFPDNVADFWPWASKVMDKTPPHSTMWGEPLFPEAPPSSTKQVGCWAGRHCMQQLGRPGEREGRLHILSQEGVLG